MDILIIYERINREYENALLLQRYLRLNGHRCEITQYYDADNFFPSSDQVPDIIFVPSLYNTQAVERVVARFGNPSRIINLQYEQVLSEKWEKLGHHNPKGLAIQYEHVCWGERTKQRLLNVGIKEENLHLIGALQLDLLHERFLSPVKVRNTLSTEYEISTDHRWKLFLSSFTYANISDERLRMNESVAGVSLASFRDIHTQSRDRLVDWFEYVLEMDKESIFIYRPHPDELNLDPVKELESRYPHFKIIRENSAKVWIEASDSIFSWYSTTVVESHYMNKPYAILRPSPLPDDFDSVLLKKGSFITSRDDFVDYYINNSQAKALNDSDVKDYYINDFSKLVVEELVGIVNSSRASSKLSFSFRQLFLHRVKSLVVKLIFISVVNKNTVLSRCLLKSAFITSWKKEIEAQQPSDKEKRLMINNIEMRLSINAD
ncbi:MAG: surface carbohydrate biosynthesis protein [Nitrincola lacisaponensis]|uniref:surface carbohydrate biosynthesis protein n=1 Tax=Nitrincola lacisaponensis TaxID=267850 RepID=UPI00391C242E